MAASTFTSLPPELIVECSDYLDGCDLYHAFYGLNQHINNILDQQCHRLHVNLIDVSKSRFDWCCEKLIPRFGPCLVSLTLGGSGSSTPGLLQQFLHRFNPMASAFPNLETLRLLDYTRTDVQRLLPHLPALIQLKELTIGGDSRPMPFIIDENDLFETIVVLPMSLRSLTFPYKIHDAWIRTGDERSAVERLQAPLTRIGALFELFKRFPRLRYLMTVVDGSDELQVNTHNILNSSPRMHALRYLNVNITPSILFEHFASFLRSVPQLRTLLVEALNPTSLFWEAQQWQMALPGNLVVFRFDLTTTLADKPDPQPLLQAFQSEFWTSRSWLVQGRLRDRGRYYRFSTVQSPIITFLYWPDDEVLLNSTSVAVYPHVTHVDLWWNLAKSTYSICPSVRSVELYGCHEGEIEPIHPNVHDLLQTPSLKHLMIAGTTSISQLRFATALAKSAVHVDTLSCHTDWLLTLLETKDYEHICLLLTMRIRKLVLEDGEPILPQVNFIAFARTFLHLEEITMRLASIDDMFFFLNVFRRLKVARFALLRGAFSNLGDLTERIRSSTILLDFTVESEAKEFGDLIITLWIGSQRRDNASNATGQLYLTCPLMNSLVAEDFL